MAILPNLKIVPSKDNYPDKWIIIDLDGTLANIDHRVHHVKSHTPDWDAFYNACGRDVINPWCAELMRTFWVQHYGIAIVSGRRKSTEKITESWLKRYQVCYDRLYLLRENEDYTPDHELKKKWLDSFGRDKILFVVDDRQRVVDMWRAEGLVCLQCYAWEEFKK